MAEYVRGYNPNRSAQWNYGGEKWKLSRSKIDLFIECPRCFYVDNKLGTKRPSIPSFNLNIAVDELLKKEFDVHRKAGTPHPIMEKYKLEAVPYQHANMDAWRDPFIGITYLHPKYMFTVSGGIDDIWVNPAGELIVVDYKATSKDGSITTLADSSWEAQYRRQVGVYQWLLRKNGFNVSDTAYFVYCNGLKTAEGFGDTLTFETTLIPCTGTTDWIEPTLKDIKACLESNVYPPCGPTCEYCQYREAVGKKLQAIHKEVKSSKILSMDFTTSVKNVVRNIGKGSTMTYKEVAKKAGNPKAARAVARIMANNYDPQIPCHRVIRSDGTLGGYNRGGILKKQEILETEKIN